MISIKARDVLGCERAEITCGPIALVAGPNGAGKSSLAKAVSAALSGRALMVSKFTKATAGKLVRDGAEGGSIELRDEAGTARLLWPACEIAQSGKAPHASTWAAGLDRVAEDDARERAQVLAEYLKSDPTREDLAQALTDAGLGIEKIVAIVWDLITAQDWDGAHAKRKEIGAELKGRWRQATGANYGSRIAQSWKPEGWSVDLAKTNAEDLAAAIAEAKEEHTKAIAAAAASGVVRDSYEAAAAQLEERRDELYAAEIEETRIEEELGKAEAARVALPPAGTESAMLCPHCGKEVVLRRIDLATHVMEKAEKISAAELKKRRLAIADADGTLSRLRAQVSEQARTVERTRYALQLAAEAGAKLRELPPPGEEVGIDGAAARLAQREAELRAFEAKRVADELHERIANNDKVLDILAPDGLRARKLARVLDLFNRTLAGYCASADWRPVEITPAMAINYGGRPYALCSTSEQYRVHAVLAIAMAQIDQSDMIVLDGADILDGGGRSDLLALLDGVGLPALVTMTLTRREQVPDLAAAELGASYWIEGGLCEPLQRKAQAA